MIAVEGSSAVADAYDAWDVSPCTSGLANEVVSRIGDLIDQIHHDRPTLKLISRVSDLFAILSVTLISSR